MERMGTGEYPDLLVYYVVDPVTSKMMIWKPYNLEHFERISNRLANPYSMRSKIIAEVGEKGRRRFIYMLHQVVGSTPSTPIGLPWWSPSKKSYQTINILVELEEIESLNLCLLSVQGDKELFSILLEEMENHLAWTVRSITCPKCGAKFVYKDADAMNRAVQCQNCLNPLEIPENHPMFSKSTFPDISIILEELEVQREKYSEDAEELVSKIMKQAEGRNKQKEEKPDSKQFQMSSNTTKCSNCGAKYLYRSHHLNPDGTVDCQNCGMKIQNPIIM